jgi:AbrB family transcriptional regulator (stage V sporulation protein T)
MKATGIVRRIDDLGRVVIPKEIRRNLRIREGEPLEIYVDREGEVILKKYSAISGLGDFAQEYADSLNEATGYITCIADRDHIIAVAGAPKKDYLNKPLDLAMEKIMEERKTILFETGEGPNRQSFAILDDDNENELTNLASKVIAPIIAEGDPIGAVIIISMEQDIKMGQMERKLAETAASFIAKQME